MDAMEFVRWFPAQGISQICAVLLSVMAVLPIVISLIYQDPLENVDYVVTNWERELSNLYALGPLWYHALLFLGFPLGLIAALLCAKRIDAGKPRVSLSPKAWKSYLLPIGLLLMLLWSVPSALLSGNIQICFLGDGGRHEGVVTYFFYALVFIGAIQISEKHMKWVVEILCATCAFTGILACTHGQIFQGIFYVDMNPRAAMFHNGNHYGYYLAICLPVCFGLCMEEQGRGIFRYMIRALEFWLICNAVVFCSCRGSFLAVTAAMIGWNISVFIQHKDKWKKCLAWDIIFVMTILVMNTENNPLQRMSELAVEMEVIQQENNTDALGNGRGILWRYGIQFALERPLFGYGPDNLRYLYSAVQPGLSDRPHNEFIQFAASLGFPALAFYLVAIGGHVATFFCNFRRLSLFQLALFASVGSYLVSSIFGNTMYNTTPYYIMMLAFSYRVCNPKETQVCATEIASL